MLLELARVHYGRLLIAYAFTTGGMIAGLLYPLAIGFAINGVLSGDFGAVLWLVGCHSAQLVLTVASKRYDTRVFTRIYGALASRIVDRSRAAGMEPARVAARVALSREYTSFLEEDVSRILYAAIALSISMGHWCSWNPCWPSPVRRSAFRSFSSAAGSGDDPPV
ncbi:ABC transporter six-transmembrane domain-containing protein [Sphingosinicella soli]|uniref:ABC-type multidrug transport system fused ATPase/permease subunit n=1 Tax=Sphingosinicella soli TaxID=333708 RepID=A0A7W7B472_9SPHN|nr:ABC transporter six-transmembrane domain-containing protein [Sphingosinicella soli]MBB4633676.1 ABC-type multidrug transport system fused ATPase/permease subunit [Sphingosinicella soli]